MIQVKKSYVLELSEDQARELYVLLRNEKDNCIVSPGKELVLVYNELRELFDSGIR